MLSRRGVLALAFSFLASALLLALGCNGDTTEPAVLTTVRVTPSTSSLDALGNTAQFTASALDQNGETMTGVTFSWSSSSPGVATVDQGGLATAVSNGSTNITATAEGVSGAATLTVDQAPSTVTIAPDPVSLDFIGATVQFNATVEDANGNPIVAAALAWSSDDPSVATIDQSTGEATAVDNGTTTITATANGTSATADLTVAQVPASVTVTPDPATLVFVGETQQYSAVVDDAGGTEIAGAMVTWSSSDPTIVDIDASGLATAVHPGSEMIIATADPASGSAAVTVDIRRRPDGDIVLYRNYDPWGAADTAVLNAAPFNYVEGTDYLIAPVSDMQAGIPATTSLVILPSASSGDMNNQISDQIAAAAELESWVRAGGWLVVHGADNDNSLAYSVPGLTGDIDDSLVCNGKTLLVSDHALVRGPDAVLGTGDDLTDANIDLTMSCYDNHGSLASVLPGNADVLIEEDGGSNLPLYATYDLDAGRVIVTSITLEYGSSTESLPTIINHFYWAINGLDAPAAPAAPGRPPITSNRPAAQEWLDSQRRAPQRQN